MADALLSSVGGVSGTFGMLSGSSSGTISSFNLDHTGDKIEFLCQTLDDVTITKLGVRLTSITGTTPTYRVSIQGINGSGRADGTIKASTNAYATFSPSGLGWSASSFNWLNLTSSYACGAGEFISIVIDYSSGTINGSNFASFGYAAGFPGTTRFPHTVTYDADTTTTTRRQDVPMAAYGTASSIYGCPVQSNNVRSFNVDTAGSDEYGLTFTLPAAWGSTYQLLGIRTTLAWAAGGSTTLILYGGSDATAANSTGATSETTVFQNVTFDHNSAQATSNGSNCLLFDENSPTTLYYGATYRIALQPQNTNNVTIYTSTLAAAADMAAFPLGTNAFLTKRIGGGTNAWTDVTTERWLVELILADITEPSGGGVAAMPIGGYVL